MGTADTRGVIAAGAVGNVLEWYDFAIYGYFAASIGQTFFPKEDPVAQLLASFGIFAVGYRRPVTGSPLGSVETILLRTETTRPTFGQTHLSDRQPEGAQPPPNRPAPAEARDQAALSQRVTLLYPPKVSISCIDGRVKVSRFVTTDVTQIVAGVPGFLRSVPVAEVVTLKGG